MTLKIQKRRSLTSRSVEFFGAFWTLVWGAWMPTAQADYIYKTFDVLGGTGTSAYGINNAGQAAGSFDDSVGTHGFIRNGDGTVTTFDGPGSVTTLARGLTNSDRWRA